MQERERQHHYFGALSLNNSAVALLERGRNCQALAVLQDAMFAMREVTQHRSKEPCDDRAAPVTSALPSAFTAEQLGAAERHAKLEDMLRCASRFVLESSGPAPPPSPYPAVTISTQVLDMDMPQLSVSNQGLPAVTDVTLIRIEATQCPDFGCINENQNEDEAEADGPQIESIAILHNFAAASRLHPLSEQSLRRRAVTVTHLAYCLSCRLLQGENYLGRQVEAVVAAHGIGIGPFLEQAMLRVSLLLIRCNYQHVPGRPDGAAGRGGVAGPAHRRGVRPARQGRLTIGLHGARPQAGRHMPQRCV
jgi:hypothetical protein